MCGCCLQGLTHCFNSPQAHGIDLASILDQNFAVILGEGRRFTLVSKDDASPKHANRIYPRKRKALVTSLEPSVRIKRLTLDLPEPLHRAIKKSAAEEGVTMAQRLRAILAEKYHFTEETP